MPGMAAPPHLIAACAFALVAAFCGWRGALPPNPDKGPRLTPWRFLMVLCAAVAIVALRFKQF